MVIIIINVKKKWKKNWCELGMGSSGYKMYNILLHTHLNIFFGIILEHIYININIWNRY